MSAKEIQLGDEVEMNETSPYFHDWRGAKMKVICLRLDPDGVRWASVIEGMQRHRGNGVYDSETTDIDTSYLTSLSETPASISQEVTAFINAVADCEQSDQQNIRQARALRDRIAKSS